MIKEAKINARTSLAGNWTNCAIIALVVSIITSAITYLSAIIFPFINILASIFLLLPIEISVAYIALNVYRKTKNPQLGDISAGFKTYTKSIELGVRKYLIIFLFTLLLIIPGIIKRYAYSCANYFMLDDENLTPKEALKKSEELTNGSKFDLLLLDLSFIGWYLLSGLTLGILLLWVVPYHTVAKAAFYQKLRESKLGEVGIYLNPDEINSPKDEFYQQHSAKNSDDYEI